MEIFAGLAGSSQYCTLFENRLKSSIIVFQEMGKVTDGRESVTAKTGFRRYTGAPVKGTT
jgi:hypothetical protein